LTGTVEVRRDGRLIETLKPEKRILQRSGQTMTIAAIDTGFSAICTSRWANAGRR